MTSEELLGKSGQLLRGDSLNRDKRPVDAMYSVCLRYGRLHQSRRTCLSPEWLAGEAAQPSAVFVGELLVMHGSS